ncbi:MAG: helix-turn-helix domain-containing protein [Pseudomonadota bacterium]
MEIEDQAEAFAALGHPLRLAVFRLLARRAPHGVAARAVAEALGVLPQSLTRHLDLLVRAGLADRVRQGRSLLYSLGPDRAGALLDYFHSDCCRGRADIGATLLQGLAARMVREESAITGKRKFRVLFIGTRNAVRSIFAEAILRAATECPIEAWSAGTDPADELPASVVAVLQGAGYVSDGLGPKSVSAFSGPDAPRFDMVITLCDQAANRETPVWPGQPIGAHWAVPDPVQEAALADTLAAVRGRVAALKALPFKSFDRVALQRRLDAIGAGDFIGR